MTFLRKPVALLGVVVILAGMAIGASELQAATPTTTSRPAEGHPAIEAALKNLRQAKKDLERGAHDFGGHRVAALKATDLAISECEQALKFDK